MIEKQLFMVWVGKSVPDYAQNALSAFREMNPSFSCDIVHCENENPGIWAKRLENYKVRGCAGLSKCLEADDAWHRCLLSNLIRYWLIQTSGGIYADCDMFPIRPFDELVPLDRPFRITKVRPTQKIITDDINFMGCPKGCDAQDSPAMLFPIKLYDFGDPAYLSLRKRFFSCSMRVGEHYNDPGLCYVDHYDSNTYGRNKNTERP